MEQINNDQTIKECSQVLGHQVESTPQLDTSKIILVADINPKLLRRINVIKAGSAINATTTTLYTTPTDRDFYLVCAELSTSKDVTATTTATNINVILKGESSAVSILGLAFTTLTAQNSSTSITFPNAMLLERGTAITVTNNTNVSAINTKGAIQGYLLE